MIVTAIQKTPQSVWVYNESGNTSHIFTGHLIGYTSNTVTIRPLSALHTVNIYDEKGKHLKTLPC